MDSVGEPGGAEFMAGAGTVRSIGCGSNNRDGSALCAQVAATNAKAAADMGRVSLMIFIFRDVTRVFPLSLALVPASWKIQSPGLKP